MAQQFRRRPPRLVRVFDNASGVYFVTFNAVRGASFLADECVHEVFRRFADRAQADFNIAVGRYVLMPDHIHLFVQFPGEGITLERWVQSLRSVIGKQLLALGFDKPHWQHGFFDHLLRSRESYAEKWEYVRRNPVGAGLCAFPEEWPFQGEAVPIVI